MLWRHGSRSAFRDPMSGKDAGFFVFSLPFQLAVSRLLLWLIAVAAAAVGLVYRARGALRLRPLRVSYEARVHLAALAAVFLLVVAWRFRLERYVLELGQPSPRDRDSFAGAGYVDVHVRSPGLAALSVLAVVTALACWPRPAWRGGDTDARAMVGRRPCGRPARARWSPSARGCRRLVQRFAVDPNPVLSEAAFLEAIDRGDEERPRSRLRSRLTRIRRARCAQPTSARSDAAGRRSGLGHADARGQDARPRHRAPYYRSEQGTVDTAQVAGHHG